MSVSRAEKFEEFCLKIEHIPDASLAEIASKLGISLRTAQRYQKKYFQVLQGDFVSIDDYSGRAIRFLLWISSHRGAVPKEKAKSFFTHEFIDGEKTFQRFINKLKKELLLKETPKGYQLGEKILPRIYLSLEELDTMTRFIQGYEEKGPLGQELKSVLSKLCLSMINSSPRLLKKVKKRQARMVIKGPNRSQSKAVFRKIEKLIPLAMKKQLVEFIYLYNNQEFQQRLLPCYVVYNSVLDQWYLAGINDINDEAEYYRLDLMRGLKAGGPLHKKLDSSKCDRLKFAMGSENGPLFKVVIRFKDDFNVLDKVKRDAALRPSASWREEPDGSLLFYDTVAGLGEISRWVRQFGASAKVIEPPELSDKIKEGARRKLARYGLIGDITISKDHA